MVIDNVSDIIIKPKSGKALVLISLDEYNLLKENTYLLMCKNRVFYKTPTKNMKLGKEFKNT
tara:strand:+ start:109 stop:294 length:186 start_codon:yes stop_codon:yes gene_type:complete